VRPVNKHCEWSSLDTVHNARIAADTYYRRSVVEPVIASLRCRFDETSGARIWYGQYGELVLKAAVINIEDAIKLRTHDIKPLNTEESNIRRRRNVLLGSASCPG